MQSLDLHFGQKTDPAIANALKTIERNPKFLRAITFSINSLYQLSNESGTQNRENCYHILKQDGHGTLKTLLDLHMEDSEVPFSSGKSIQSILVQLEYPEVVEKMIKIGMASTSVKVLRAQAKE